jgi:3-oxoacyl-[acyl-carrier protein] reductase
MQNSLGQKNALVAGGSRGIGRAIALALTAEGASVAIGYVKNDARADQAVKAITGAGGRAIAIKANLSQPSEALRLFDEAEQKVGHLDIVVASAADMVVKPLLDCTEEDYDRISIPIPKAFSLP